MCLVKQVKTMTPIKTWEEWDKAMEPYFNKPKRITRKLLIDICKCMMIWKQVTKG